MSDEWRVPSNSNSGPHPSPLPQGEGAFHASPLTPHPSPVSQHSSLGTQHLAVEAVYRLYCDAVTHMLQRRVGNPEDAADLAQEAFLRLLRYEGHSPESLRFLLFRVAMNLAASHLRQQAMRPMVDLDDVDLIADHCDEPDMVLADSERIECFLGAVQSLPDRPRQMFVLRRLEGKGTREVADEVGLSTRMVEQHLTKAHALLKARVATA